MTYDQSVKVTEHGNGLSNDPGDHPASQTEADPDPNRPFATPVNQIRLVAKTEIDVFETDVTIDHTGSNNLLLS